MHRTFGAAGTPHAHSQHQLPAVSHTKPCCPTIRYTSACSSTRSTTKIRPGAMSSCLLLLPGTVDEADLSPLLHEAYSRQCSRVYLYLDGSVPVAVNAVLLQWLAQLYAAVGQINPRWDVIPCLQCAGWTPDRLGSLLPDVQLLLVPAALQQAATDLQQHLSSSRPQDAPRIQLHILQHHQQQQQQQQEPQQQQQVHGQAQEQLQHDQQAKGQQQQQQQPGEQVHAQQPPQQAQQQGDGHKQQDQQQHGQQQQDQQQQHRQQEDRQQAAGDLQYHNVAVGGTFDRLHAGHRLLLAATALVATHNVFVGITADNLLAKKANKHLLQDYEHRRAAAVDFMALVRPGLAISAGALTDPQEPTQAELDETMQALVVSAETVSGGEAINRGRQGRGFEQLQLVVVGLVGGSDASSKLSSTALRQADAGSSTATTQDL